MKRCKPGSKEHADATRIVEYLQGCGGKTRSTQTEIAWSIGFIYDLGGGHRKVNEGRFRRAINHLNDGVDDNGLPCCASYRVNYRRSGPTSTLALIDQKSNSIHDHAAVALAEVLGMTSRERQWRTEVGRIVSQLEALSTFALANEDQYGYRVCQRAVLQLDEAGTISSSALGELHAWAERSAGS